MPATSTTVRSYLTAGVVTVGAGAIALSPIAPTMPQVHLPSVRDAQVQLSAAVGPVETWLEVINQTITNVGAIGTQVAEDPAPILSQILKNQLTNATTLSNATQETVQGIVTALQGLPDTISTAAGLLAKGDVVGAANALLSPVLADALGILQGPIDAFGVVTTTAQNITNFLEQIPNLVINLGIPILGPVYSVVNAMAATAQTVLDDTTAGDFGGIVNALVNAPATLTGAILNGYGAGPLGDFVPAAGLLTPADGPFGSLGAGPIAALLAFRDNFAAAITPTAKTAAAVANSLAAPEAAALPAGGTTAALTTSTKAAKPAKEAAPEVTTTTDAAADATSGAAADTAAGSTDTTASADSTAPSTTVKAKHRAPSAAPADSGTKKGDGTSGPKAHKSSSGKSAH